MRRVTNSAPRNIFEKAADEFGTLSRKDPQNAELYNRESGAWYLLGKYEKSIALLEKAISLQPDYADAWVGLGANNIELGRFDQAREQLQKAKELHRRQGNMAGIEEAEDHLRNIP